MVKFKNKKDVIRRMNELGDLYIAQGIQLKHLSLSFESRIKEYSFKDMKNMVEDLVKRLTIQKQIKKAEE